MEETPPPTQGSKGSSSSHDNREATISPTLASASSGGEYSEGSQNPTQPSTQPQTQTITAQIRLIDLAHLLVTNGIQIHAFRVLHASHTRPHTELVAIMDDHEKAKKQKDDEAKPASHAPNSCPGADKCKRLTCNHWQHSRYVFSLYYCLLLLYLSLYHYSGHQRIDRS